MLLKTAITMRNQQAVYSHPRLCRIFSDVLSTVRLIWHVRALPTNLRQNSVFCPGIVLLIVMNWNQTVEASPTRYFISVN